MHYRLTDEQRNNLKYKLLGTCMSIEKGLEEIDADHISEDTAMDQMLDVNVEYCLGCHWWFESGELEFNHRDEPDCNDCL